MSILHVFNKTPINWFSELQSMVKTATFRSKCVAVRTCADQIILDLRQVLRCAGVPVKKRSMMFDNNESVVNTASVSHSRLLKWHHVLSCH